MQAQLEAIAAIAVGFSLILQVNNLVVSIWRKRSLSRVTKAHSIDILRKLDCLCSKDKNRTHFTWSATNVSQLVANNQTNNTMEKSYEPWKCLRAF